MTNSRKPLCSIIVAYALLLAIFPAHGVAQDRARDQARAPSGKFRVAGTVMNVVGGHPLAGTRVVLASTRNRQDIQTLVTGEDGRFEFWVNAGKYSLEAAKRGFIRTFYMQHRQFSTAIVTGAGLDTENLMLRVAPTALITGKVLDEYGEPVRQASVSFYVETHQSGVSQIRQLGGGQTDDQGSYESPPLDDGTYFVAVRAKPWYAVHPPSSPDENSAPPAQVDSALDVAYPLTYYADVTDSQDATPIPIRGGDRVEVDIHLGAVHALHLVVRSQAEGNQGFSFPSLQVPTFDGMTHIQGDNMHMTSPGVFEIAGIPPGRYSVQFHDPTGGQQEPTEVDLTSNSQELEATAGNPSSTVNGKVRLRSGEKIPDGLGIGLRGAKGRFAGGSSVDDKGEVTFRNVIPGVYHLVAGSSQKPYAVRITSAEGQHTGSTLEVPPGSTLNISLSLVGGEVTVEGFAKRAGKAASGAMVVLVPKDPEANPELFRRDQSDQDGSFSLPNVIPGPYTILAIDDGWDLDWAKPAVIAHYAEHGQNVVITDDLGKSTQLADPVEIQPK